MAHSFGWQLQPGVDVQTAEEGEEDVCGKPRRMAFLCPDSPRLWAAALLLSWGENIPVFVVGWFFGGSTNVLTSGLTNASKPNRSLRASEKLTLRPTHPKPLNQCSFFQRFGGKFALKHKKISIYSAHSAQRHIYSMIQLTTCKGCTQSFQSTPPEIAMYRLILSWAGAIHWRSKCLSSFFSPKCLSKPQGLHSNRKAYLQRIWVTMGSHQHGNMGSIQISVTAFHTPKQTLDSGGSESPLQRGPVKSLISCHSKNCWRAKPRPTHTTTPGSRHLKPCLRTHCI